MTKDNPSTVTDKLETPFTIDVLMDAIGKLEKADLLTHQEPVRLNARWHYLQFLKADTPPEHFTHRIPGTQNAMALFGFPVYVKEDLPDGVLAEFVNRSGKCVGQIRYDTNATRGR